MSCYAKCGMLNLLFVTLGEICYMPCSHLRLPFLFFLLAIGKETLQTLIYQVSGHLTVEIPLTIGSFIS